MSHLESSRETIIGRYYLVPCVRVCPNWDGLDMVTPIFGPLHEDAAHINFPHNHYHIDWRFVREREWRAVNAKQSNLHIMVLRDATFIEGPFSQRRRCARAMPEFSAIEPAGRGKSFWPPRLEAAYAGQRMNTATMICPHRGLCLKGLPVKDGAVVCPGHGLQFDVKTGELRRRYEVEE